MEAYPASSCEAASRRLLHYQLFNHLQQSNETVSRQHRAGWSVREERTPMTSPFCVVDSVSEPRCVYDGEPHFDSFLFDADGVFDDVDRLINPFCGHMQVRK